MIYYKMLRKYECCNYSIATHSHVTWFDFEPSSSKSFQKNDSESKILRKHLDVNKSFVT